MKKLILSTLLMIGLCGTSFGKSANSYNPENVPARKQTPQGKYLSVHQAHELLSKDTDIIFIDVRDSVEVSRAGHPDMIDAIVPIHIQTNQYNEDLGEFMLAENPNFISEMSAVLKSKNKTRDNKIIITCGSGVRSAMAAHKLSMYGYTNVWHIHG